MTQFLEETFQARDIKYNKAENWREQTSCQLSLPAPGLGTYSGMSGTYWIPKAVTYHSKNGEQALPPAENGFITLYLNYKRYSNDPDEDQQGIETLKELRISCTPNLHFPKFNEHMDKKQRTYRNETKNGNFYASWSENWYADYRTEKMVTKFGIEMKKEYIIKLSLPNRDSEIAWIGFEPKTLKSGTVTCFFEDIGYIGLDRLF